MSNVKHEIKGDKLIIEVDLTQRHGISNSGNTITIASTQGSLKIGKGDVTVSMTVYTKEGLPKARLEAAKEAGYKTWEEYDRAKKGTTTA